MTASEKFVDSVIRNARWSFSPVPAAVLGAWSFRQLPIEAYPNIARSTCR